MQAVNEEEKESSEQLTSHEHEQPLSSSVLAKELLALQRELIQTVSQQLTVLLQQQSQLIDFLTETHIRVTDDDLAALDEREREAPPMTGAGRRIARE